MSSNIMVQRICQLCGTEFTARTTVTKYCSHKCSQKAYKLRIKNTKVEQSNKETQWIKNLPIEQLNAKDILSVREVSILLGCSLRITYRLIGNGPIKAVNLAERMTRVKRTEIDKLVTKAKRTMATKVTLRQKNI